MSNDERPPFSEGLAGAPPAPEYPTQEGYLKRDFRMRVVLSVAFILCFVCFGVAGYMILVKRFAPLEERLAACESQRAAGEVVLEQAAIPKPEQSVCLTVRIPMFAGTGSMEGSTFPFGVCNEASRGGVCAVDCPDMYPAGGQVWRDSGKRMLFIDGYVLGGPPFERYKHYNKYESLSEAYHAEEENE